MRLLETDRIPTTSIYPENGVAYIARVPGGYPRIPDSTAVPSASHLELFENGQALGPAHSLHDDIRKLGNGRYSDWTDGNIIFSASDNSDPRRNGRSYAVRYPVPRGSEVIVPIPKEIVGFTLAAAIILVVMAAGGGRGLVPATDEQRALSGDVANWAGALSKVLGLALIYVVALVVILAAYRARQRTAEGFKINFEYKVF